MLVLLGAGLVLSERVQQPGRGAQAVQLHELFSLGVVVIHIADGVAAAHYRRVLVADVNHRVRGEGLRPVVLLLHGPLGVDAAVGADSAGLHQLRALRVVQPRNVVKVGVGIRCAVVVEVAEAGDVHVQPGEQGSHIALADEGARLRGEGHRLARDPELEVCLLYTSRCV